MSNESIKWPSWKYADWNRALINHCFLGDPAETVERIPATVEEFCDIANDHITPAQEIRDRFINVVKQQVPKGKSLYRFCTEDTSWAPTIQRMPRFFAFLWLTCHIAYGYPDNKKGFHHRLPRVFEREQGKFVTILPDLWESLAEWLSNLNVYRLLVLPPYDHFRSNIGHSWFLAFPHSSDRRVLGRLLHQWGLLGDDPPLSFTIEKLRRNIAGFSDEFQKDFHNFVTRIEKSQSARETAFWRAVRQAALTFVPLEDTARTLNGELIGSYLGEKLTLHLAVKDSNCARFSEFKVEPLEFPLGSLTHELKSNKDPKPSIFSALKNGLIRVTVASVHIKRGVLIMREEFTDLFRLVGGSEAHGARFALVRNDRVSAFTRAYEGTVEESAYMNWSEIHDCKIQIKKKPPTGLEDVHHLSESMQPLAITFVGGIRVEHGFLNTRHNRPQIRFPEAQAILIQSDDRLLNLDKLTDDLWSFPNCELNGSYSIKVNTSESRTLVTGTIEFFDSILRWDYKSLNKGRYSFESASPAEGQHDGGPESDVPLKVVSELPDTPNQMWECPDHICTTSQRSDDADMFATSLAAMALRRGGIPLAEARRLIEEALPNADRSISRAILRSWVESGSFDLVIRQGYRNYQLAPRRPRFVQYKTVHGPCASLVGLAHRGLLANLLDHSDEIGLKTKVFKSHSDWSPQVLRVYPRDDSVVAQVSSLFNFRDPIELNWGRDIACALMAVENQGFSDAPLPSGFGGGWCWDIKRGGFGNVPGDSGTFVTCHRNERLSNIYSVMRRGLNKHWSFVMNWIFISAHLEQFGGLPYQWSRFGLKSMLPNVFLPLPLGRLCSITGKAAPGPIFTENGYLLHYCYPFQGRDIPLGLPIRGSKTSDKMLTMELLIALNSSARSARADRLVQDGLGSKNAIVNVLAYRLQNQNSQQEEDRQQ